jgi:hypothetical protein
MGDYNAYQNFLEEDKSIVENSEKAGNKRPAEQLFKLVNEVLS